MHASDVYRKFAKYYDAYIGDFQADLPLYLSACEGRDPVLEVGCGTGRVLAALLEAGHSMTGVDISPDMLSIAEGKLGKHLDTGRLRLLNHDFRVAGLPDQYGCVLVTYYTFNYLLDDAEQSAFLSNILPVLQRSGFIVMDMFFPKSIFGHEADSQWDHQEFHMDGKDIGLRCRRRMLGDIEERVQIFTDDGTDEEITTLRRYSDKHRVQSLLTSAGFVDVEFNDGYDASAFHQLRDGEETLSSLIVRARKP